MKDLSHGRHNANSKRQYAKIKQSNVATRMKVLELIDGFRCTKEIAEILKKEIHKISGRFSELKTLELIEKKAIKMYKNSDYTVYQKIKK